MPRLWTLPAALLGLWMSGSQPGTALPTLSQQNIDDVVEHLTRTMDTSAQAERDPRFVGVQIITCPVKIDGLTSTQEGIYLYQEQALTERIGSPYRQRFIQIALSEDATRVEARTFKPSQPENWTGFCQQSESTVNANQLGNLVCIVSLRPSSLGYVGSTPTEGCPVNLRGAIRLTNTIVLHQDGMDTWDRGFDLNGVQVWGARAEPYQYRWLD